MQRQEIPSLMLWNAEVAPDIDEIKSITILNQSDGTTWSFDSIKESISYVAVNRIIYNSEYNAIVWAINAQTGLRKDAHIFMDY